MTDSSFVKNPDISVKLASEQKRSRRSDGNSGNSVNLELLQKSPRKFGGNSIKVSGLLLHCNISKFNGKSVISVR
jgi:hypothetical protein